MLWLVALFIILQPGIFSTKKTFVKVEDILLRALIFGIVMYFLGGSKEGFQDSIPTCNPPDGYIFRQPGVSGIKCLKQSVDVSITQSSGGDVYTVIHYNESQRITIQDQTGYYTAPLITKTQWNADVMPLEVAFPYSTHNAIFICVQSKLNFMDIILNRIPQDKWDAASSFLNSFIYEMPSTGVSLTLIPQTAAAAPPLPIEPIPAEWLSGMRAAQIRSEAAAAAYPSGYIGYTGPPPPGPVDNGPQPYNLISSAPTGPKGPPPPPGYIQAAFFGQNDINAGFDTIDTYLSQLSYGIKNLFNRQSAPTSPPAP